MRILILLITHIVALGIGFAAGIFTLPLLTAPPAPSASEVRQGDDAALFTGQFVRDLEDSDFLHYGEGVVMIHADRVAFEGTLAPGPDYQLYFSRDWVETEAEFLRLKDQMQAAGSVRTFDNFLVPLPRAIDPRDYSTVIVWCESFDQFITAARYQ